ncbi:MAG: acyltransferase [Bacteroidetes bacterium]|nr:MAG: acyltransferase [Bacteroidota bacterium]TAG89203.1 MAG: acyltransferase [Bacteroidota bacterium]
MINLIKYFIQKIKDPTGRFEKIKQQAYYIKKGWISIGEKTDITNLNIDIRDPKEGQLYIKIGSNCIIHGSIVIETKIGSVFIDDNTYIGPNTSLICASKIEIGKYVMFAWGCTVIDHNSHSTSYIDRMKDMENLLKKENVNWDVVVKKDIRIHDNVWVGFNSIIMKGVEICQGGIIAAGSVVTSKVETLNVYGGNPAKFIKKLP